MPPLPPLRLALAQVNPTVGAIEQNKSKVAEWTARARDEGAELVIFPELVIPGYPAEDLYLKPHFLQANVDALNELAAGTQGITALVGFAEPADTPAGERRRAHNALAVVADGAVQRIYRKTHLPNYSVFDEQRYFVPAGVPTVIEVGDAAVGLTICEDCWIEGPPASTEAAAGAMLIANPSASPYHRGKGRERAEMFADRARSYGTAFAFCNMVGAQDELVFDGQSMVFDENGGLLARACQFEEELLLCDLGDREACSQASELEDLAEVYGALRLGLRDYVEKNGFNHVGIALSGGIDSALVALIAADAIGADRVTCVVMPSPHSSEETQGDAREMAKRLGVELIEITIESMMSSYADSLNPILHPRPDDDPDAPRDAARPSEPDLVAENLQARIRGNLMMALSNRHGWLVLTTGNKSEMSVGYATLYGDMAGGFAVIKDVPKTLVYKLVEWRNAQDDEPVPAGIIERPPSAELRPDQLDTDSLPPYEVLDRVLEAYVEHDRSPAEIAADGLPREVVNEVIALVDRAEYKRRQAPPGIRITPRAFGRDRRLPITNRFGQ